MGGLLIGDPGRARSVSGLVGRGLRLARRVRGRGGAHARARASSSARWLPARRRPPPTSATASLLRSLFAPGAPRARAARGRRRRRAWSSAPSAPSGPPSPSAWRPRRSTTAPAPPGSSGWWAIVGAIAAPLIGRLSDRRSPRAHRRRRRRRAGRGASPSSRSAAAPSPAWWPGWCSSTPARRPIGVSNQARIYSLPAELHGRLNTVYMVTFFAGGSLGSWLGAWAWGRWRWAGVVGVGSRTARGGPPRLPPRPAPPGARRLRPPQRLIRRSTTPTARR